MMNILCTAFQVPSRVIHIIMCFDCGLKRLNDWFCRISCWRACRFGWFSIFWINCRTLVLCACFTTECGNPGIRKSMLTSFSIVCSWLQSPWSTTGLTVLSRSVSSPTLNVSLSWQERVWQSFGTFSVFVSTTSLLVLSCAISTWRSLLSSVGRAWIPLVSTTGLSIFFRRNSVFVLRIHIDLLRTGRFSSILHGSRVVINNGSPRSLTTWIWNWLVRLENSRLLPNYWSLSMFWTQFTFPFVFQGNPWWRPRGDKCTFSYMTSPIFSLTTFGTQKAGSVPWKIIAFDRVW